jgi:hypothetical protein
MLEDLDEPESGKIEDEGDDPILFRLAEAADKGFPAFKEAVEQDEAVRQWFMGHDYRTYAEWFFWHHRHRMGADDDSD